jgi:hypothetical protein
VEVTALVVLFLVPALVPVTFTVKLQKALAASVAPDWLTLDEPAVAVIVPPPHEPVSPFGVATTRPAGSVSLNPTPLSDIPALGFERVNVRVVVPLSGMRSTPKALPIVGGMKPTVLNDATARGGAAAGSRLSVPPPLAPRPACRPDLASRGTASPGAEFVADVAHDTATANVAGMLATDTPLSSIHKAIIAASIRQHRVAAPGDPSVRRGVYEQVKTHGGAGAT